MSHVASYLFLFLPLQEIHQQQSVKEPYGLNLAEFPSEDDLLIYERWWSQGCHMIQLMHVLANLKLGAMIELVVSHRIMKEITVHPDGHIYGEDSYHISMH